MATVVSVDTSETVGSSSPTATSSFTSIPSPSSSNPSSSSPAVKAALLQWDSQLKLSAAQLSALSAFQQRTTASLPRAAPLPFPTAEQSNEDGAGESAREETERKRKHDADDQRLSPSSSFSSSSSVLSALAPRSPLSPPSTLSPSFSHSAYHQHLLSTYLTSSSSSTPFTASYEVLCSSSDHLRHLLSLSSSLLSHVALLHQHQSLVEGQTNKVREECTALLHEQRALVAKAQRYQDNLDFFTAADRIAQQLTHTLTIQSNSTSSTALEASTFPSILSTIDRCTAYLQHNPSFFASSLYLTRYERLKERLLRLLRTVVTERLNEAERTVKAEREKEKNDRKTKGSNTPSASSLTSPSSFSSSSPQSAWLRSFVLHRLLAPELAPLLRDLERRAARDTERGLYSTTLYELHSVYYQQRHRVTLNDLSAHVVELSRTLELTGLTRSAVTALTTLCSLEKQLFDQLFTSTSSTLLSSLLSSLSSVLYTALRPVIIRQTSLDTLCEVIIILKEETVNDHVAAAAAQPSQSDPSTPAPLTPDDAYHSTLRRLINDSQERLSYRASVFIREEIGGYVNTPDDSDWRKRMNRVEEANKRSQVNRSSGKEEETKRDGKEEKAANDDDGDDEATLNTSLHPVLESTLLTLSKLYRCLEPSVFKILAQEAVNHCLAQLIHCAKLIAATPNHTNTSTPSSSSTPVSPPSSTSSLPSSSAVLHSQLFLIHHLLTLRSQLSPFPLDLSSSHKQLDFSHMQSILPSLFSSSAKFSSFSDLLSLSTPRVNEVRTDSKRSIEREVKAACERCIALMSQLLIGPLLTFFAQMAERQKQGKGNDAGQFRADLYAILAGLVRQGDGEGGMRERVRDLRRVLHLYLNNAVTERSLFAPVHRSLTEMLEQLKFFVSTHFNTSGDNTTAEEVESANAMQQHIAQLEEAIQHFEQ